MRRRELVIAIVIARKCVCHDLMNDKIGFIYIVRALRRRTTQRGALPEQFSDRRCERAETRCRIVADGVTLSQAASEYPNNRRRRCYFAV